MNARSYRVNLHLSPLDFPAIMGLGQSTISYQSEPRLDNNIVALTITKKYILIDMSDNKEYEVLTAQSDYEIPTNDIKSRETVYEFYKDAMLSLNEAYQYVRRTELPALPSIVLPTPSIENYRVEIERVLNLLNSRN